MKNEEMEKYILVISQYDLMAHRSNVCGYVKIDLDLYLAKKQINFIQLII